jgi:hypothetical protein
MLFFAVLQVLRAEGIQDALDNNTSIIKEWHDLNARISDGERPTEEMKERILQLRQMLSISVTTLASIADAGGRPVPVEVEKLQAILPADVLPPEFAVGTLRMQCILFACVSVWCVNERSPFPWMKGAPIALQRVTLEPMLGTQPFSRSPLVLLGARTFFSLPSFPQKSFRK